MRYRRLGKTGLNVSELSLGTWQLGGGWGQPFSESIAGNILEAAIDSGVNFLDTADVYDEQQSERMVGKVVAENRDKLHIATKIGRRINPHVSEAYTPQILEKFVDEALQNTGLEYLDLVQLHCPPTEVYYRHEIFEKLEDIKATGKVRHFGVSVEKVDEALLATTYNVIETVQIIFNMFRLKPLDVCLETMKKRDVGVIARVPLASGLLTGKISPETQFVKDDHRHFNRNGEAFDKGETFSGVPLDAGFEAVDELSEEFGKENLHKYALRWVLMFDEVSTVIPGASRVGQIESNIKAIDIPPLADNQMKYVQQVYDKHIRKHVHSLW